MKAIVFQGIRSVSLEQVADPEIEDSGDAVVKVLKTALCGSDLHPYLGREEGLEPGTVMGHEFAGVIVETGADVTKFSPGDHVVCPFTTNCGSCYFCDIGLTARCQRGQLFGWREDGSGLHGTQADFVRVPLADSTLVSFDKVIPPELALLAGDNLATGMYCAERADVSSEGVYVVLGCGTVGLMTITACLERGAENIFAFDAIPERLDRATRLGVTAVNFESEDPLDLIQSATSGIGADAVMEAVGSSAAGKMAYDLVRPGGTISTVGVHTNDRIDFSPVQAYDKNITYRVGRCPARAFARDALDLLAKDSSTFVSPVTHTISIADGVSAYDMFANRKDGCIKVILEP
ncbi:MAG: alcohol dehydrogenase catalytic domain-containing protein [Rhodothermales bacterium]|nr:alcohol dehydrogenase catalytic domain-containing protein [Rhodothermales bacterium]